MTTSANLEHRGEAEVQPVEVPVRVRSETTHRRHGVLQRNLAAVFLLVFGSGTTAFASLLVEGFFPIDSVHWEFHVPQNYWLAVGFVCCGLLTLWAAWSLRLRTRLRGTLYYLRIQSDTAPDLHSVAVSSAAKDYLGYRSITSWFDPGEGTVDIRRQVESMIEELQRATNDDNDGSGFDLAPNLIFPAALAMGFEWAPPPQVRLREINGMGRGGLIPGFDWFLHCATRGGEWCLPPMEHVAGVCHYWVGDPDQRRRISDLTEVRSESSKDPRAVWLEIRLSPSTFAMHSKLKKAADVVRTIGLFDCDENGMVAPDSEPMKLIFEGSRSDDSHLLSVLQVAEAAAYWIGQTLVDFPKATVYLAGAMPKTVAFVAGYLLTKPAPGGEAGHIWRRIVPMGYFERDKPALRPMWVRADQRNPDDLIAELAAT